MTLSDKKASYPLEGRRTIIIAVGTILLLELLSALAIMMTLDKWSDRADFGGMFGAASSLFSGLALAGVVYAILLQRQELSLQRQELELTRHELERAASAQEQSAELLQKQLTSMESARERQEAAERSRALPLFKVRNCSSSGGRMQFELENHGSGIVDLEIRSVLNASLTLDDASVIETGGIFRSIVETGAGRFSFELIFTDIRGERRALEIAFNSASRRLAVREFAPPNCCQKLSAGRSPRPALKRLGSPEMNPRHAACDRVKVKCGKRRAALPARNGGLAAA